MRLATLSDHPKPSLSHSMTVISCPTSRIHGRLVHSLPLYNYTPDPRSLTPHKCGIVVFAIRHLGVISVAMLLRAPTIYLLSSRPFWLSVVRITCNSATRPPRSLRAKLLTIFRRFSVGLRSACFLTTRGSGRSIERVSTWVRYPHSRILQLMSDQ